MLPLNIELLKLPLKTFVNNRSYLQQQLIKNFVPILENPFHAYTCLNNWLYDRVLVFPCNFVMFSKSKIAFKEVTYMIF